MYWSTMNGRRSLRFAALAAAAAVAIGAALPAAACGPTPFVAWLLGRPQAPPAPPLPPAPRLVGRVLDAEGDGVGEAKVLVAFDGRAARRGDFFTATLSDAAGGFALGPLPGGPRLALRVEKRGFASAETLLPALGDDGLDGVEVRLRAGITGRGLVLTPAGAPAAGARVSLVRDGGGGGRPYGDDGWRSSDDEGVFEFVDLAPGRYDLAAVADGYAPVEVPGVTVPNDAAGADLGTVVLLPQAMIAGRVVDDAGTPVAGAEVKVNRPRLPPATARSDADGRFVLGALVAGEQVRLAASAAGHAVARTPPIEAPADGVGLVLPRAASVAGVVVDGAGRPQARVLLHASPRPAPGSSPTWNGSWSAESDEEGRFELEMLPPGDLVLAAGSASTVVDGLAAGERREGVRLVVPAKVRLHGRVTGAGGRPLAGAMVFVERSSEHGASSHGVGSDADGGYGVDVEEGASVLLIAQAAGFDAERRRVVVGEETSRQDFQLAAADGGELVVRVLDGDGRGVHGAMLSLRRLAGVAEPPVRWLASDDAGHGSFALLSAGRYHLSARHPELGESRPLEVEIRGGERTEVELVLSRPGAAIVGTVRGVEPHELARLRVAASSQDAAGNWVHASVDHAGRFRLPVPAGTWTLVALTGDGRWPASRTVTVAEGEEVEVDLEITPGATLSGTVRLNGEPLPAAGLRLVGAGVDEVASDWQGRFRFTGLPPGSYLLTVLGYDEERRLEVDGDREFDVELDRVTLSGRVVDVAGGPLAGARVSLPDAGAEARTDPAGRFRLAAPPGEHRLLASADGYRPAEVRVAPSPGDSGELDDLVLRRGDEAVLLLGAGAAFERVGVSLFDAAGGALFSRHLSTDGEGRVEVGGLPVGAVELLVESHGWATETLRVEVPGPPLPLDRRPAARVDLSVPALAPLAVGATARLLAADGEPFRHSPHPGIAADRWPLHGGATQIGGLPAGAWTAVVEAPDGRTWSAAVTVAAGETARLVLE